MGGASFAFSYLWRRERAERGIVPGDVEFIYALI